MISDFYLNNMKTEASLLFINKAYWSGFSNRGSSNIDNVELVCIF